MGLSYAEHIVSISSEISCRYLLPFAPFEHTMHERDRQTTDEPRNGKHAAVLRLSARLSSVIGLDCAVFYVPSNTV